MFDPVLAAGDASVWAGSVADPCFLLSIRNKLLSFVSFIATCNTEN